MHSTHAHQQPHTNTNIHTDIHARTHTHTNTNTHSHTHTHTHRYELLATFGCEGTVGSVAVGNVDTVHSVDDGWVKFFLPVYEKDRIYMLKCGGPPTMGFVADDDW